MRERRRSPSRRGPRRCVKKSPGPSRVQLRALAPELLCLTPPGRRAAGIGATSTMTRSAMANKETTVAELTETFRNSNAIVLTEYRGLTVAQLKELRTNIRADASYAVVKNTLTKIAAKDAGVEGLDDLLEGPSAIAFVHGDTVAVAKALRDFAKANPLLVVKGGYFDGAALTAAEVG